jgi:phage terminase small subunit
VTTKRTKQPRAKPAAPQLPATAAPDGLTDKERLFVAEYLVDLNAGAAAMRSGRYSTINAARVAGHTMRRKPAVQQAIQKAIADHAGATRSRIVEEISRIAFSNVADVMEIKDGHLIVRDHADLDRDTLSTVASIEEVVNDKGYRTLRVRQHDRLQALTILAKVTGLMINRQEISGPGGAPVQVDQVDHRQRIMDRFNQMADRVRADREKEFDQEVERRMRERLAPRLPGPTEQPITDVTPQKVSPAALLAARLRGDGERD